VSERRFWLAMTYGCDSGDPSHEVVFYLEEGCEGPRVRSEVPATGEGFRFDFTADGREVVPVPFVAGRCPACERQAGCGYQPRGPFGGGFTCGTQGLCSLTHIRWNEDQARSPAITEPPDGAGAFLYPTREERRRDGASACGRPVYPLGAEA
jgi:hypothetical protein